MPLSHLLSAMTWLSGIARFASGIGWLSGIWCFFFFWSWVVFYSWVVFWNWVVSSSDFQSRLKNELAEFILQCISGVVVVSVMAFSVFLYRFLS